MENEQIEQQRKQIRAAWESKESDLLLQVWQENNRLEWCDEVFEVIHEILIERIGDVPPQNQTISIKSRVQDGVKINYFVLLFGILIAFLTTTLYLSNYLRYRNSSQVYRDETKTIQLTGSTDPWQYVFEGEKVRITIGNNQLVAILGNDWRKVIATRPQNGGTVSLNQPKDEYIIAKALESGQATVFDKHRKKFVSEIYLRYYDFTCGPLCGSGSRTFFLPNKSLFSKHGSEFFHVTDKFY